MNALKLILALAFGAYAACSKINLPTDFSTVASGTRANLKANFDEIDSRSDACFDSTDEVRGRLSGYTGDFTITSLDHLRLRLDGDGSTTGKFIVMSSNLDSLFRVSEDSTARFFGAMTGTSATLSGKLSASDSVVGAHLKTVSGNLIVGGTSTLTGAVTLTASPVLDALTASLPVFTNGSKALASNAMTGTGSVMMSASPTTTGTLTGAAATFSGAVSTGALSATTGSFSSTLGVTGAVTGSAGITSTLIASGTSRPIQSSSTGPALTLNETDGGTNEKYWNFYSNAGTFNLEAANDAFSAGTSAISITRSGATPLLMTIAPALAVTGAATMAGITSSGDIAVSKSTASNASIISATQTDNTSGTSHARFRATVGGASGGDAFSLYTVTGATDWAFGVDNSDGDAFVFTPASTPGGATNGLRITTAGVVSVPNLTASRTVITDGSSALTTNTETGTGSHVRATSPTLVTPVLGAASATSITTSGVTAATGGLTLGARFIDHTTSITSNTTLSTAHSTVFTDATSGAVTLTLPAASGNAGLTYTIFKTDASANTVTADGNASETIGGATTVILGGNTSNSRLVIVCDGTNWQIKDLYEEGAFTATMTGVSGSVTATARWRRSGKMVTLRFPGNFNGTSTSTSCTITGLPTAISAASTVAVDVDGVMDNGNTYPGIFSIATTTVTLYFRTDFTNSPAVNSFTASGTKGLGAFVTMVTYQLE